MFDGNLLLNLYGRLSTCSVLHKFYQVSLRSQDLNDVRAALEGFWTPSPFYPYFTQPISQWEPILRGRGLDLGGVSWHGYSPVLPAGGARDREVCHLAVLRQQLLEVVAEMRGSDHASAQPLLYPLPEPERTINGVECTQPLYQRLLLKDLPSIPPVRSYIKYHI